MDNYKGTAYDKLGRIIEDGDLLKIDHFTARLRRQKHYMYKRACIHKGFLYADHLSKKLEKGVFDCYGRRESKICPLFIPADNTETSKKFDNIEILQSDNLTKMEQKKYGK
jgi:hypothetical protein